MVDVSRRNDLRWDCLLCCEMTGVYKPLPEAYLAAPRPLGVQADEIMMVACHNFDLLAARDVGFSRTQGGSGAPPRRAGSVVRARRARKRWSGPVTTTTSAGTPAASRRSASSSACGTTAPVAAMVTAGGGAPAQRVHGAGGSRSSTRPPSTPGRHRGPRRRSGARPLSPHFESDLGFAVGRSFGGDGRPPRRRARPRQRGCVDDAVRGEQHPRVRRTCFGRRRVRIDVGDRRGERWQRRVPRHGPRACRSRSPSDHRSLGANLRTGAGLSVGAVAQRFGVSLGGCTVPTAPPVGLSHRTSWRSVRGRSSLPRAGFPSPTWRPAGLSRTWRPTAADHPSTQQRRAGPPDPSAREPQATGRRPAPLMR